jgi:hypothetical protein
MLGQPRAQGPSRAAGQTAPADSQLDDVTDVVVTVWKVEGNPTVRLHLAQLLRHGTGEPIARVRAPVTPDKRRPGECKYPTSRHRRD